MGRVTTCLPSAKRLSSGWREFSIIHWLRQRTSPGRGRDHDILGIGDDASAHRPTSREVELVTCDALIEGVHWEARWCPPAALGFKTVAVNVSDIAAMGGVPQRAHLILALPAHAQRRWVETLLNSMIQGLKTYHARLMGGDTVISPGPIVIALTLQGTTIRKVLLKRQGARPGDVIMVTGDLGGAAAGLATLRQAGPKAPWTRSVIQRCLHPEPRLHASRVLALSGQVHAMIDISDGFGGDLRRLAEASRVGVQVDASRLPIAIPTRMAAQAHRVEPLNWAVSGGEDYELLFTCSPQHAQGLARQLMKKANLACTAVGQVVAARQGLRLKLPHGGWRALPPGWEHQGKPCGRTGR